jgi:exodeoxyribonuclease VII large subunit
VLRSVRGVEAGSALRARLVDGELGMRVEEREIPKPVR